MDISHDITYQYVARVKKHDDELGIVLKGHLLLEHVMNLMIEKGFKQPRAILSDHRSYSFSVKARLLFESNDLPEHVFNNITRLNRIRNELAHKLNLDEAKIDFCYSRNDKEGQREINLKQVVKKNSNPLKRYLYMLAFGTLSQIQREFFQRYGTYPLFEKTIELK
ncbi:MAG: hypothetical protein CVU71_08870 [Deltaproteobacteria bacterium HGW-Deltaproteobacteria-6]|nr:MAG: hypothetical protein CVU71_08870 [Deltaproteobacteria bacterium HGW-Deltaproteobacteria-6]